MRMPAIFFGHGSPMNAIETNQFTQAWVEICKNIPLPFAILAISAHWETIGTNVTSNKKQKTIHDFGGFPDALFKVQYNPEGSLNLVERIKNLIPEVKPDPSWGLDHGTWSILKHIYPNANIPTLQLSIDQTKTPIQHYNLAKKLAQLRNEGILIIGSGNIVHNLRKVIWCDTAEPHSWAVKFSNAIKKAIVNKDHDKVINYVNLEGARESVPSSEHFIPLLYILAQQQDNEKASLFADEHVYGSLSMTGVFIN